MYYTDDPIADFERYSAQQEDELRKLPICIECKNPIQSEYCYGENGKYICENCLKEYYRHDVEDLICDL